MAESEDIPNAKQLSGTIPLFFYDLVGHIVPGTALILGFLIYIRRELLTGWLPELQTVFPKESTAGYAAAMILLFFAIAHFCGSLLPPLSYQIERVCKRFIPLNLKRFAEHFDVGDSDEFQLRFKKYFGTSLQGPLDRPSAMCSFYVWRISPTLGMLTARTDADLLGARSLVLVFLILLILPFLHSWTTWPAPTLVWSLCMGIILFSSFLTFLYLREKRVFVRCILFMAVTSKAENSKDTLSLEAPGKA